jgi:hypothetical protein
VVNLGIVRVAETVFSDEIQDMNNNITGDLSITKISISHDRYRYTHSSDKLTKFSTCLTFPSGQLPTVKKL